MAGETYDAAMTRLAAMPGPDKPEAAPEQVARVARAGRRIGEGYRPFPPECGHGAHRLEAL